LEILRQDRSFTALGRELRADGLIGERKLAELIDVIQRHAATARELGATELRAVATDAVRRAANGRRLARELAERTGTRIEILSAGEEARLAFAGAVGMLEDPPRGLVGVVDVGGGSCELVVGRPGRPVSWWQSVPLGSSSLTDGWLPSDPPAPSELLAARDRVRDAIAGMSPPKPDRGLAVGGSATSLGRVTGRRLDAPAFAVALQLLGTEPAAVLGRRIGVDPRRVRLLPAALLLLDALAARLGVPLAIARGGIREGLLLEAELR
jgi:exopolyphosphatase/guanosine-5'-triphosphate,3'-diphosphate pyrophosphatase